MTDLSSMYSAGSDENLDRLYDSAMDAFEAGSFEEYARAALALDLERVTSLVMLIGLATTLLWPELRGDVLPDRARLLAKISARVRVLDPERHDALLAGLL